MNKKSLEEEINEDLKNEIDDEVIFKGIILGKKEIIILLILIIAAISIMYVTIF